MERGEKLLTSLNTASLSSCHSRAICLRFTKNLIGNKKDMNRRSKLVTQRSEQDGGISDPGLRRGRQERGDTTLWSGLGTAFPPQNLPEPREDRKPSTRRWDQQGCRRQAAHHMLPQLSPRKQALFRRAGCSTGVWPGRWGAAMQGVL